MKRVGLALVLSAVLVLALAPRLAQAHHRHHGVFVGCCVFIEPGHAFFHHRFLVHPHVIVVPRDGFVHPFTRSTVIVTTPAAPVWAPGFWQWTGIQWVWVPGHWVVPDQTLFLRNPCD